MTDVQARHQTLTATRTEAANRVNALQALAMVQILTFDEESELVLLQSRLAHMQPLLEAAAREQVQEAERLDVEGVCTEWTPLVEQKVAAVAQFVESVRYMWACFQQLVGLHKQQESLVGQLPRQIQTRLNFPDTGTFRMRLVGSMRNPMGWTAVLLTPQGPEVPRVDDLTAVDPGCHALTPRVITRFLEGRP